MTWEDVGEYFIPATIVIGTFVVGYIVRSILFRYLQRLAERTTWEGDDIVIAATRGPFLVWIMMLGIYIALQTLRLEKLNPQIDLLVKDFSSRALLGLAIFSVTLTTANILADLIRRSTMRAQVATPGLIPNIIRILVIGIGVLVMLSTFLGFDKIAPILTAFGVGGLAVALALQDTLSNLFAGFYITLNKQVRVGDFLKLETGFEGIVVDINWRTTTIKDSSQNLVIVPNAKLAQMTVTNFALPEPHMTVRVNIGVSYDVDPIRVEKILLDEAKKVMTEFTGFIPNTEPLVRITNFSDSSIDYALFFQIKDYTLNMPLQTEMRKHIYRRFKQEGIEIPYPTRTLYVKTEGTQKT
ncbi:mechanosensitive ion channel family protein [Candidatus Acetothermia bacterium]|nr:mechanosensitive ion channel family protein [Candidatus Acetothermia bacterium]